MMRGALKCSEVSPYKNTRGHLYLFLSVHPLSRELHVAKHGAGCSMSGAQVFSCCHVFALFCANLMWASLPGCCQPLGLDMRHCTHVSYQIQMSLLCRGPTQFRRLIRGQVNTSRGWQPLALLSGAYAPDFGTALARFARQALRQSERRANPRD